MRKWGIIAFFVLAGCSAPPIGTYKLNDAERKTVLLDRLKLLGVKPTFIAYVMNSPRFTLDTRYVKMNVLIFKMRTDYPGFLRQGVIADGKAFMKKYAKAFRRAEKKFGVPKELITALISVETRLGRNTGSENIASVFFSMAMADQQDLCDSLIAETEKELQYKIPERCTRKGEWARAEILSLQEMHEKRGIPVAKLSGSFAGAFGLPQFVPTSYLKWAAHGNANKRLDLYEVEDAIFSVGNYLKQNGWGKTEEEKKAALFHYNHSTEYGITILELAKLMKTAPNPVRKKPVRVKVSPERQLSKAAKQAPSI